MAAHSPGTGQDHRVLCLTDQLPGGGNVGGVGVEVVQLLTFQRHGISGHFGNVLGQVDVGGTGFALFGVLEGQPHDLAHRVRTDDLLGALSDGLKHGGQIQYLDHTFVGFVVDEFFKAAQELVAKFFLFFRGLRLLEVVKSDDTVELSIVGVAPFRFHFFVFWPRCRIFKRCRQRHEVLVVKNRCELFASDCDVTWTNKSSVDQDYSSFRKQIELR